MPKEILEALEQERDKLAFEIEFLQKELVEARPQSRLPFVSRSSPALVDGPALALREACALIARLSSPSA